jgi:hypothetical protein
VTIPQGDASPPIEFTITYAGESQQKYAIRVYAYHDENNDSPYKGEYRFIYYRNVVRQGKVLLNEVFYPIAIIDENNFGRYSDLDNVDVMLDLNGNGKIEEKLDEGNFYTHDSEIFRAKSAFTLNSQSYIVESIAPNGSQLIIKKK